MHMLLIYSISHIQESHCH